MVCNLTMPGRTIIGEGAFDSSLPYLKEMGKKALIITGKIITKTGLAEEISEKLSAEGIKAALFNDLPGEPGDKMIENAYTAYRRENCDFIIGLGGGTPLDTAKAVKDKCDYLPPLVLIPTTAGTGSEATKFYVYTDTKTDAKLLMKSDMLLPQLAVIDYKYTLSAPRGITVATGMDALTHAVEAYTSKKANSLTDLYCLDAIERIFKNLPLAAKDGSNKAARESLAIAAYEAGIAINNSSVTLVHGMSRPIGALFHVAHGISNAMLITECLRFALDGAVNRFADISRKIGASSASDSDEDAAEKFITALDEFTKSLEIPTLREYGINLSDFEKYEQKMAKDALASGSPGNTRKEVTEADILKIYKILREK